MGSTTPNLGLYKPVVNETGWEDEVNANFDILDGLGYQSRYLSYERYNGGSAIETIAPASAYTQIRLDDNLADVMSDFGANAWHDSTGSAPWWNVTAPTGSMLRLPPGIYDLEARIWFIGTTNGTMSFYFDLATDPGPPRYAAGTPFGEYAYWMRFYSTSDPSGNYNSLAYQVPTGASRFTFFQRVIAQATDEWGIFVYPSGLGSSASIQYIGIGATKVL